MSGLVSVILGAALLFAGRRLIWLFVGALGFIFGMELASLLPQLSEMTVLVVGLIFGIIFAVLAVFLQRFAIGVAGFLAGGFILTTFFTRLGVESLSNWVVYIIGGLIGLALVFLLFDWTLIIFSSLAGAALLLQSFSTETPAGVLIFFLLALIGIIIQGGLMLRNRRRRG